MAHQQNVVIRCRILIVLNQLSICEEIESACHLAEQIELVNIVFEWEE